MRNILPVREHLKARHVWAGGGCPFCPAEEETMDHLFCSCLALVQVWHGLSFAHDVSTVLLLTNALCNSTLKEAALAVAKLWMIWAARNEVVWKGNLLRVDVLLSKATWLCNSWLSTYCRDVAVGDSSSSLTSWTPPTSHQLKCNVDAAIFYDGAGFGVVVRDHTGRFVAAHCARLGCGRDPYLAEAMAVREALSWLMANSFSNFILESDSLNFCFSFNYVSLDLSYVGLIVKQCRNIAHGIGNVSVHHVRRSANRVAHALARATGSSSVLGSWMSVPPACIANLVAY